MKVRKEQNEGVRIWKQAEERDIKRLAKISHLESVILAADEVLRLCTSPKEAYDNNKYWDARKEYNQQKSNLK